MVYLVGAGPGDPGLLTLRGKALLEEADVVIYDYLINPVLLNFVQEGAQKIYVGKKGGSRDAVHQTKVNRLMIESAATGKCVVRLKGGDPFIFGRGGEEAEALAAAGIPFEIVPGVTAAIGVPTYAGIPLTHRDVASTVSFITGHEDPTHAESHLRWAALTEGADTLVFLMGMGNLAGIVGQLLHHGKDPDTPIALVQWGTYPSQRTLVSRLKSVLDDASAAKIKPPVVMVVGKVVLLRDQMNWYESKPLFGKRIVVTRSLEQGPQFGHQLQQLGASVIYMPTIQIRPPRDWTPFDAAIAWVERYRAILFTSVNGVRAVRERMAYLKYDLRQMKGVALCAIGPQTATAIEAWGLQVDLIPTVYTAEGFLHALMKMGIADKRFLLLRAKEARDVLPKGIQDAGGTIDVIAVYEAVRPDLSTTLKEMGDVDMVTFASASTLRNFVEMEGALQWLNPPAQARRIACIGPITAAAAEAAGLHVDVVPKEYTITALTQAIADYFSNAG